MRPFLTHSRALLAATLVAGTGAAQATIVVPDDHPTIQGAINVSVDGGTILVKPGTYAANNLRLYGKAITLESEGGKSVTSLSGGAAYRIFDPKDGEGTDTIIDGFRIRDGRAPSGGGTIGDGGGAVLISNSSPWFKNCEFRSNAADNGSPAPSGVAGYRGGHGGAVYVTGASSPTFVNSVFVNNEEGRGGSGGGSGGKGGTGGKGFGLAANGGNGGKGGTGGQGGDGAIFVETGAASLIVNCTFHANLPGQAGSGGPGGAPGTAIGGSGNGGGVGSLGTLGACTGPVSPDPPRESGRVAVPVQSV